MIPPVKKPKWRHGLRIAWLDYQARKEFRGEIRFMQRKNILWGALCLDVKCDDGKYRTLSNPQFLHSMGLLSLDPEDTKVRTIALNAGPQVKPYRVNDNWRRGTGRWRLAI